MQLSATRTPVRAVPSAQRLVGRSASYGRRAGLGFVPFEARPDFVLRIFTALPFGKK